MDDVAKWLAALGLSKYAEEFAKNDVGSDVLPQLTEEHLKDLGVSLGDRLRLLEAIDALVASQAEDNKALPPSDAAADRGVHARRSRTSSTYGDVLRFGGINRDVDSP